MQKKKPLNLAALLEENRAEHIESDLLNEVQHYHSNDAAKYQFQKQHILNENFDS